jgi:hypothetical protein
VHDHPLAINFAVNVGLAQIQREGFAILSRASDVLDHMRIAKLAITNGIQLAELVTDRSFKRIEEILPIAAEGLPTDILARRICTKTKSLSP